MGLNTLEIIEIVTGILIVFGLGVFLTMFFLNKNNREQERSDTLVYGFKRQTLISFIGYFSILFIVSLTVTIIFATDSQYYIN